MGPNSRLRVIFPDVSENAIELAATTSSSLDEAVDAMLSENSNTDEGTSKVILHTPKCHFSHVSCMLF